MVPYDRSYTTCYWADVNTALYCTIFELFDPEGSLKVIKVAWYSFVIMALSYIISEIFNFK